MDGPENISTVISEIEDHIRATSPLLSSLNAPEIPITIAVAAVALQEVLENPINNRLLKLRNTVDDWASKISGQSQKEKTQ